MKKKRTFWTKKQLQVLKEMYADYSSQEVADKVGRDIKSVYCKANSLGLKKSEAFLKSDKSGRLTKFTQSGKAYRFKKGQKSWNKGMKGLQIGGKETQFKKGHLPHNTKEDGAISIRTDKTGIQYKYIRISLGKWNLLHREVWKEHNGEIPRGHVITFVNGNSLDCEIENLKMITMAQNAIRNKNKFNNYPEGLKETIKVFNKLNKSIRNAKK